LYSNRQHITTGQQPLLMRVSGATANKAAETMRQVAGLAIKNPPIKTHPKNPQKTTKRNPLKWVFLIFNFYENNTNFSLRNRFL
jgi:hypothetical protein